MTGESLGPQHSSEHNFVHFNAISFDDARGKTRAREEAVARQHCREAANGPDHRPVRRIPPYEGAPPQVL